MSSSLPPSARHGLPGGHEAQQVVLAEAWSGLAKVGPAELKKEAKAKAKKAKNESVDGEAVIREKTRLRDRFRMKKRKNKRRSVVDESLRRSGDSLTKRPGSFGKMPPVYSNTVGEAERGEAGQRTRQSFDDKPRTQRDKWWSRSNSQKEKMGKSKSGGMLSLGGSLKGNKKIASHAERMPNHLTSSARDIRSEPHGSNNAAQLQSLESRRASDGDAKLPSSTMLGGSQSSRSTSSRLSSESVTESVPGEGQLSVQVVGVGRQSRSVPPSPVNHPMRISINDAEVAGLPSPADPSAWRSMYGMLAPLRRKTTADGEDGSMEGGVSNEGSIYAASLAKLVQAGSGSNAKPPASTLAGLGPAACFGLTRGSVTKDDYDDEVVVSAVVEIDDAETEVEVEAYPRPERVILPRWDSIRPAAVGLKNLGNTCFINVALQCLVHTPSLVPVILPPEELQELELVLAARRERQEAERLSSSTGRSMTFGLAFKGDKKSKGKVTAMRPSRSMVDLKLDSSPPPPIRTAPSARGSETDTESPTEMGPTVVDLSLTLQAIPSMGSTAAEARPEPVSKPGSVESVTRSEHGDDVQVDDVVEGEEESKGEEDEGKGEGGDEGSKEAEGEGGDEGAGGEVKVVTTKPKFVPGSMAAEFKQILKAFALAETKSIDPTELVKIIRTHPLGEEFCDGGQHDCQEIMRVLMDSLHEDLNRARKEQAGQAGDPDEDGISEREKADRAWRRYLERDHSPITDLFCGQLQSSITCHKCETRCTMYEPFWDLSIPITKESMNKKGLSAWFGSGEPSLEDCLRAFTSDEILSGDEGYMCDTCKEVTTATKRLRIHRFPNTLIVHMKRFKCTMSSREKINRFVQYPATDLRLHEFSTAESGCKKGGATYDLVGQCLHSGTMLGGHYTSACRVEDSQGGNPVWQLFNDDKVNKLHVSQLISSSAYILFYSLRPEEAPGSGKKEKKKGKARKGEDKATAVMATTREEEQKGSGG